MYITYLWIVRLHTRIALMLRALIRLVIMSMMVRLAVRNLCSQIEPIGSRTCRYGYHDYHQSNDQLLARSWWWQVSFIFWTHPVIPYTVWSLNSLFFYHTNV